MTSEEQLQSYIKDHTEPADFVRPAGTRTGRFSNANPDLQQLPFPPFERKKLIIPPPGSVIYWDESGELMLRKGETE